ncbi:hypothetical protein O988_04223, partial [Pseudogymnoascus sp. VKM F-3808]
MTTLMAPTHHHTAPSPPTLPYLSHPVQAHLRKIYTGLCGESQFLSRERLAAFLADVQGQTIALPEDVKEYTYEDWLALLWMRGGLEGVGKLEGKKDLGLPISSYYISSSHNTYLSGNQLMSKSTTDAYKTVLIRGCRCIEIDVHNGEPVSTSSRRPHITGTTPSELAVSAKLAKKKYKRKYKAEYKAKLGSLKGHIPWGRGDDKKEHAATEANEKAEPEHHKLGHKKTASNVPSINREKTSDSDSSSSSSDEDFDLADESPDKDARSRSSSILKGEPLVLHAWTLTQAVGFREVCRAVRESAFQTTNLPLIVSLQVGCDLDQQEVMVQIMKEEWAGVLVDTAHPTCHPEERLPRLDELLNKILIKVKRSAEVSPTDPPSPDVSMTTSSNPITPITTSTTISPRPSTLTPTATVSTPLTPTTSHDTLDALSVSSRSRSPSLSRSRSRSPAPKKKSSIHPSLSALGIYTHSSHFSSLTASSASIPSHIYSLSEGDIEELYAASPNALLAHNRRFMMRAYPAGFRVDSSNPDPSIFWRKGIQMAALNWQVWDAGTMLNEAMFADSDGWVLKPPALRDGGELAELDALKVGDGKLLDLRIKIFAAQRILGEEELRARVKVE